MAQFVVRQLEENLKARLQERAKRNGRSMEAEVREILRNAVAEKKPKSKGLGSSIAARFRGTGLTVDLPEIRGQKASAAEFSK